MSLCFLLSWHLSIDAQFSNLTSEAGIVSTHRSAALMGGGGAMVDVDNDGWLDIVLTGGRNIDKLFLNNRDGTFAANHQELIQNFFPPDNERSSVTFGDLNNDGCQDLVFTTFVPTEQSFILKGGCDASFELIQIPGSIGPSIGSTLLDYDLDGLLDIYLINYIDSPSLIRDSAGITIGFDHTCYPNRFFKNLGNFTFEEVTDTLGVQGNGCALAVLGYYNPANNYNPTFYVANDFGEWIFPNEMFVFDNSIDQFIDIAPTNLSDEALYGMGIALGDIDLDEQLDLLVTNIGQSSFLKSNGNTFQEIAQSIGIVDDMTSSNEHSTGWGTLFTDMDNDGDEDIIIAKGYIPAAPFLEVAFTDSCRLYVNDGGSFTEQSMFLDGPTTGFTRGAIKGDVDNDGDEDILFTTVSIKDDGEDIESEVQLLINEQSNGNNYLNISLEGTVSNKSGIGVIAKCYAGDTVQTKVLYSGGTHASQNADRIHFGIGTNSEIDSIAIRWPSGQVDRIQNVIINQWIKIEEGNSNYSVLGCMDLNNPNYNPIADEPIACQEQSTSVSTAHIKDYGVKGYFDNQSQRYFIQYLPELPLDIALFDLLGRSHWDASLTVGGDHNFDFSTIPKGMHFISIRAQSGQLIYTDKIVLTNQ